MIRMKNNPLLCEFHEEELFPLNLYTNHIKWAFLAKTLLYENRHYIAMGYLFLTNLVSKVGQDFKVNGHKIVRWYHCAFQNHCAKHWGRRGDFDPPSVLRVKKNKNKSLFNWVVIECVFYSERCMCVNDSVIPKFYKMHPSSTEKKNDKNKSNM